jgi:microcystin-dependent protein
MPVESANTISGLDDSWPLSGDFVSEGDNHLRLIKAVLKSQFGGASGEGLALPIVATEQELNWLTGLVDNVQDQLDAQSDRIADLENAPPEMKTGMIMMWAGSTTTLPEGWILCDGQNGAPDLRDRFIIGAGQAYTPNATGGNSSVVGSTQGHALTIAQMPRHNHELSWKTLWASRGGGGGGFDSGPQQTEKTVSISETGSGAAHSHTINIAGANLPPYYALAFIMKT